MSASLVSSCEYRVACHCQRQREVRAEFETAHTSVLASRLSRRDSPTQLSDLSLTVTRYSVLTRRHEARLTSDLVRAQQSARATAPELLTVMHVRLCHAVSDTRGAFSRAISNLHSKLYRAAPRPFRFISSLLYDASKTSWGCSLLCGLECALSDLRRADGSPLCLRD